MNIKLKNLLLLLLIIFLLYLVYNRCNNICNSFSIGVPKFAIEDIVKNKILHIFESDGTENNLDTIEAAKEWLRTNGIDYLPDRYYIKEVLDIDEGGAAEILLSCGESGIPGGEYGEFQKSSGMGSSWRPGDKRYYKIEDDKIKIYTDSAYSTPAQRGEINICTLSLEDIQASIVQDESWHHFKIILGKEYYIWAKESNKDNLIRFHSTIIEIIKSNSRKNDVKKFGKFNFFNKNKDTYYEEGLEKLAAEEFIDQSSFVAGIDTIKNTIIIEKNSININNLISYTINVEFIGLEKRNEYVFNDPNTRSPRTGEKKESDGTTKTYSLDIVHDYWRKRQDEYYILIKALQVIGTIDEAVLEADVAVAKAFTEEGGGRLRLAAGGGTSGGTGILIWPPGGGGQQIDLPRKGFLRVNYLDEGGISHEVPPLADSNQYFQKIKDLAQHMALIPDNETYLKDIILALGIDSITGWSPVTQMTEGGENPRFEKIRNMSIKDMNDMFKVNYNYYITLESLERVYVFKTINKDYVNILIEYINRNRQKNGIGSLILKRSSIGRRPIGDEPGAKEARPYAGPGLYAGPR